MNAHGFSTQSRTWVRSLCLAAVVCLVLKCESALSATSDWVAPLSPIETGCCTWYSSGCCTGHLGIDYFPVPHGTLASVRAIANAYDIKYWTGLGSYGGCPADKKGNLLWLKHRKANGDYFWVQYGHVKSPTYTSMPSGRPIYAGETIATLANYDPCCPSGDNCPHLHFGIWDNAGALPTSQLGYDDGLGVRSFVNPDVFRASNSPWDDGCVAPPTPTLSSPSSGATCQATSLTLDWASSPGGEGYDLQVSTASNCASGTPIPLPDNSSYAPAGLAAATTYYWRVRSKDACGAVSPWSSCWSFTTAPAPPSPPTLLSPGNGAVVAGSGSVALDWSDAAGAVSYEVQVGTGCGNGSTVTSAQSAGTATDLIGGVTYSWRVRAQLPCGVWSAWSACFSFTAGAGCLASGPCPGREIPHSCMPATACCPSAVASSAQLPDLTMTQWGDIGCPVADQIGTGRAFSVGLEFKTDRAVRIQFALGGFGSEVPPGVVLGEATLEPGDGDWRPFWSAPLHTPEVMAKRLSNLKILASPSGNIQVRRVRIVGSN